MQKRFLYSKIVKYLEHKNALIITGMHQVGKTTLMRQIFAEVKHPKLWFDFDNPLDLLHFENINYDAIYETLKSETKVENEKLFVFIDEIQNFPEITKIIKYLIDKYKVKFIVSGSSNYYLKNLFPESLSGRKFLFVFHPLSFSEYLLFKNKSSNMQKDINFDNLTFHNSLIEYKKYEMDYYDYIEFGKFPDVVTTADIDTKKQIIKNIFSSFFEKDIKILSDIKDIRELRDLILLLVPRIGNMLDVTKISSELKINRVKLYNYLELLQGVFFLKLIPKYSKSIDRSVAGGKKVYFADTGLLNVIGRVNDGQLFENMIASQLADYGELSFYNKRNSSEIDFILNKEIALEVKLTATNKDLTKLKNTTEKLGIEKYYLISKNFTETEKTIYPMFI